MLFLGTEKYPEENAYHAFVQQHGGHSKCVSDRHRDPNSPGLTYSLTRPLNLTFSLSCPNSAFTSDIATVFYFDVAHTHLQPALDRFSQFFIAPLMDPSCTERY